MEFPEIGERCFVASCKQLDFLPIFCDFCHETFCVEHQSRDAHGCIEKENEKVAKANESSNVSYACQSPECKILELVPVKCPDCCKNFCLRHRHPQDHDCEKHEKPLETELTPKEKTEAIIGREIKASTKNEHKIGKQSKTAAKVALMKLKMHAVGDRNIAQADREYFTVQVPNMDNTSLSFPMFFSKAWLIGKIIDNIATHKGLSNKNNEAKSKKLRLFNVNNELLDSSRSLQDLIDRGCIQLEIDRILKLDYVDS